jgi:hypothetical protein
LYGKVFENEISDQVDRLTCRAIFMTTIQLKTHEDYGEWSYLEDKAQLISEDIANYERLAAA